MVFVRSWLIFHFIRRLPCFYDICLAMQDDASDDNIWGSHTHSMIQLYGLFLGLCMSLCVLGLFISLVMVSSLADIPGRAATVFMVKLGPAKTQIAAILWWFACILFLIAQGISITVLYDKWVSYVWIAVTVLISLYVLELVTHAQCCKNETLHVVRYPELYRKDE